MFVEGAMTTSCQSKKHKLLLGGHFLFTDDNTVVCVLCTDKFNGNQFSTGGLGQKANFTKCQLVHIAHKLISANHSQCKLERLSHFVQQIRLCRVNCRLLQMLLLFVDCDFDINTLTLCLICYSSFFSLSLVQDQRYQTAFPTPRGQLTPMTWLSNTPENRFEMKSGPDCTGDSLSS